MNDEHGVNLESVLELAVNVAKEAGNLVLKGFYATKCVESKTTPSDLVTEYDKGSEKIIISELLKVFPSHKIIGEETISENGGIPELTNEPTWIIDPIDGTINYVHTYRESAISIALSVNKEIVVGVIYNPMTKQLFSACKGKGAYENGKRINVSQCTELAKSLVGLEISFAGFPAHHNTVIERFRRIVNVAHGIRSVGSAALSLCLVANGSFDAYHIDGLQCWDVAAGILIIKEAGGIVLCSTGGPFNLMTKKLLVAATSPLAKEMVKIIKIDEN